MKNVIVPIAVSLLSVGLLASCGKHEPAGAGAPNPQTNAAKPPASQGPAPAPRMTLKGNYLVPEEYAFAADAQPGGNCALDAINGARLANASLPSGSDALFGGWAVDAAKQLPADALFVLKGTQSSYAVPLVTGGLRPDVARSLGNQALESAGFNLPVRLSKVAADTYGLFIVYDRAASDFCALKTSLVIQ